MNPKPGRMYNAHLSAKSIRTIGIFTCCQHCHIIRKVLCSLRKKGENKRRVASPQAHQFQSQFRTCGKVLPPYDSQSTVFNDNAAQILTGELLQSKSDIVTSDCNGSGAK